MQLEANTLREMYFYSNAMIVNEDDSLIYNQIKGRQITGYFQDGDLYKVSVRGNGESIYFGKDEQDRYLGVNQAVCSDIDLYIRENQFRRISFRELPEATFSPMQQIDPASFRLDGFRWAMDLRPTGRDDLSGKQYQMIRRVRRNAQYGQVIPERRIRFRHYPAVFYDDWLQQCKWCKSHGHAVIIVGSNVYPFLLSHVPSSFQLSPSCVNCTPNLPSSAASAAVRSVSLMRRLSSPLKLPGIPRAAQVTTTVCARSGQSEKSYSK